MRAKITVRAALLATSSALACIPIGQFDCSDAADCGPSGQCEPDGFCSLPDEACESTRRYTRYAPDGIRDACTEAPSPAPGGTEASTSTSADASTTLPQNTTSDDDGSSTSTGAPTSGTESGSSSTGDDDPLSPCVAPGRASAAPLLLYDFCEGKGGVVSSVTDNPYPLRFTTNVPNATQAQWVSDGMYIDDIDAPLDGGALIADDPLFELIDDCRSSGAFTAESWTTPFGTGRGPMWMLDLRVMGEQSSTFHLHENLTFMEKGYTAGLVTAGDAGSATTTWAGIPFNRPNHVVFVRDASGTDTLYLDGEMVETTAHAGDLSEWDPNMSLTIAGQPSALGARSGQRYWIGTLHMVAFYCTALTAEDVALNFAAGHRPPR